MTEPSEAAFSRADGLSPHGNFRLALALLIQQVSDAAKEARAHDWEYIPALEALDTFILPEPVDPVHKAIRRYGLDPDWLISKLEKDGLKIVKDET